MSPLPPLPNWSSIHPLFTHVPIVLLLLSPVTLVVGAMADGRWSKRCLFATLLLLGMGTAMLPVATATGVATADAGNYLPEASGVLEEHRSMARHAISAFIIATLLLAVTLLIRAELQLRDNSMISSILPLAFLVFYSLGMFYLVDTALHGFQIVHGHAFTASPVAGDSDNPSAENSRKGRTK